MLTLAHLLSSSSFFITFINTNHIHTLLLRHSPTLHALSKLPNFRFRVIPDGLPEDDPRPFHKLLDLEESMRTRSREPYREILDPGNGHGWPPVSCVVADGILSMAMEVPEEFGIPVMIFRTSSACSLWAYCCIPELIRRGKIPFPDGADLDEKINGIAGMEGFVRLRDLPSLMRNAKTSDDRGIQFANIFNVNLTRARALILNTFEELESSVLSYIRSLCPITYTLGPLHVLIRNIADNDFSCNNPSLWQEDKHCLKWLDDLQHKSVVYISFGSSLIMSQEELLEFWHGLVNSGKHFLWVMRPDLIQGFTGPSEMMIPSKLEEATRKRGCLVGWAPQREVLAHPAIGCFFTHSGWNSTMESITTGVPMICRPFLVDQLINSRYVSEAWKIGVDMKDMCGSDIVERMIREAMEGEKAEELRRSINDLAKSANRSVEKGGASYENVQNLIEHIKSLSSVTID